MDRKANNVRQNSATALDFAPDLLYGFDIQDEISRDFLESLVRAGRVPDPELREVFRLALLRGKEEWDMILDCTAAIRNRSVRNSQEDPGLVPPLAYVLSGQAARDQQKVAGKNQPKKRVRKRPGPKWQASSFWQDDTSVERKPTVRIDTQQTDRDTDLQKTTPVENSPADEEAQEAHSPIQLPPDNAPSSLLEDASKQFEPARRPSLSPSSPSLPWLLPAHHHSPTLKRTAVHSLKSPFFTTSPTKKRPPRRTRPPRGTVSSLPVPPLSAPRFGLVQESLAHDPFRLLIAVTFLIRTSGRAAIPVFGRVVDRFPTPEAFVAACAACASPAAAAAAGNDDGEVVAEDEEEEAAELWDMIAHLGLPAVRCAAIGRYARGWIERPPRPGVRFVVRGYPKLVPMATACRAAGDGGQGRKDDAEVEGSDGGNGGEGEEDEGDLARLDEGSGLETQPAIPESAEPERKRRRPKAISSEWEIGHLTQGPYAIDSWRIFCRDIFLGKSDNWMGPPGRGGGEAGEEPFEPEWMRVLPQDKELRACLRWMWMREGFEWDPVTGQKAPLREEMRMAVEEGRVKYDEKGELVILERDLDSGGGSGGEGGGDGDSDG